MPSRSIAIVGCGPKGLYALDSLCLAALATPSTQYHVHVFENSPHPGAGPIYDPGQPDILVMNFPAGMIDAWTDGRGPSLVKWLADKKIPATPNDYVPRAVVGEYLFWCFNKVAKSAPPNMRLNLHATHVTALTQKKQGWRIQPKGIFVDEVLVSTGHQDWCRAAQTNNLEMIHSAFPVDTTLSIENVPSGGMVACKGFALTFLDTMLALTEGRGGTFSKTDAGYIYHASGAEPALIAPFSRTGRPMRAKIDADQFAAPQNAQFWQMQARSLRSELSSSSNATFRDDVWPALLRIAEQTVNSSQGTAAAFYEDWANARFTSARCRAELRKGYEIAIGAIAPDIGWSVAEAWRRFYPTLVSWISHRELIASDAAFFREVAAEMERLAFGPPAQNVGKLISLEASGLVSFEHLAKPLRADVTINATVPAPGAGALSEPLSGLYENGVVENGILNGLCINEHAQVLVQKVPVPGLSIIGRATEGSVLGNDTLSRTLHNLPEKWAARVTQVDAKPALYLECPA